MPLHRQCEVAGSQAASTISAVMYRSRFTVCLITHSAGRLKALAVLLVCPGDGREDDEVKRVLFSLMVLSLAAQAAKKPNILFAFADDWGRYASAYAKVDGRPSPNEVVRTPHFDRVAREGVLFKNAFVTAPSCTPCRSSLLSGQYFYRTGRAAILQGAVWDDKIPSFPLLLRDSGYHIGETYKVWTPGTPRDAPFGAGKHGFETAGGRFNGFSQNVSRMVNGGQSVKDAKQVLYDEVSANFESFLKARPADKPFCYWFGPTLVHRKWIQGSGKKL